MIEFITSKANLNRIYLHVYLNKGAVEADKMCQPIAKVKRKISIRGQGKSLADLQAKAEMAHQENSTQEF